MCEIRCGCTDSGTRAGRLRYSTSTCSKPSEESSAVTVARVFLRAASRMPSPSAVCWDWSCALARVTGPRAWPVGTTSPVERTRTRVRWSSSVVAKSCAGGSVT